MDEHGTLYPMAGDVRMSADPRAVRSTDPCVKMMADPRATGYHGDAAAQIRATSFMQPVLSPYHVHGVGVARQDLSHIPGAHPRANIMTPVSWPAPAMGQTLGMDMLSSPVIGYVPLSHAPAAPLIHMSFNAAEVHASHNHNMYWPGATSHKSFSPPPPPLLTRHREDRENKGGGKGGKGGKGGGGRSGGGGGEIGGSLCNARACIVLIMVAFGASIIASGMLLWPKNPDFDLMDVRMSGLKIRSVKLPIEDGSLRSRLVLDVNLTIVVSVNNPNHVGVFYGNSETHIIYRGRDLGKALIPAGWEPGRSFSVLEIVAAISGAATHNLGPEILADFLRRKILLEMHAEIPAWVEIVWMRFKFKARVECNLLINPISVSLIDKACVWKYM